MTSTLSSVTFPLWPDGAPGALGSEERDIPTLSVHLPAAETATGTAVVVCPGGGYGGLADDHEGRQIVEWLNARGVAAFLLRYRLGPRYHHPIELGDAQRAMRIVRARAGEWGVDPQRIGIWGFSAGGHLVSTVATHFDGGNAQADDLIEHAGCRPDFLILCYPVVTMKEDFTHMGSRLNLLGENPDPALVEFLSNELQVTPQTPPTFIFHTSDDPGVPVENSVQFYLSLRRAGVPAEMHLYAHGRHGVGLAQADAPLNSWPERLEAWLAGMGLLGTAGG